MVGGAVQARPQGLKAPLVSKVQPNEEKTCFRLEPGFLRLRHYSMAVNVSDDAEYWVGWCKLDPDLKAPWFQMFNLMRRNLLSNSNLVSELAPLQLGGLRCRLSSARVERGRRRRRRQTDER